MIWATPLTRLDLFSERPCRGRHCDVHPSTGMVTWYLESGGLLSVVLAQPFLHTPDLSTPEHEARRCFEIHRPVELSRLLSPFQRLAEPS